MNANIFLSWPIFAGIAGLFAAIKWPKLRVYVGAAAVVYVIWALWKHHKASSTSPAP